MTRVLDPGHYGFDDVAVGASIATESKIVTAAEIDAFAALTGDRFEIHMDDKAAARHGFPSRVAHGLLVLSIVDGLKNTAGAQFRARASLEWTWNFRAPVLAGDRLRAEFVVLAKRPTRHPDQGILRLQVSASNADTEALVQSGENQLLVYR